MRVRLRGAGVFQPAGKARDRKKQRVRSQRAKQVASTGRTLTLVLALVLTLALALALTPTHTP